jgi:hypothetical protein
MLRERVADKPHAREVTFAELFDALGTDALGYGAGAKNLSGSRVAVEGFLSHSHGFDRSISLVQQPGLCPDCAGVPVAVIALPGIAMTPREGARPVRVVGRLDFGLRIVGGTASMLRIEDAAIFETADAA